MENKEKYIRLCDSEESVPLFQNYKWLDAAVGRDQWNVALAENGSEITGALPYFLKKKMGFRIITMPPLIPYLGPWLRYPADQKYTNRLSHEKKVLTDLIEQLPDYDAFTQNCYPAITNWLPFYWHGFEQTTRYTYILDHISGHNKIFEDFRENIRREIRKAEKDLVISEGENISELYRLNAAFYKANQQEVPFSEALLKNIFELCLRENCGQVFYVKDQDNHVHAGALIVWDKLSAYYLVGAANPEFKTSGALSFLLWHAIRFSSGFVQQFNFEGSMIEPVERFFRAFGGQQTPYFQIRKINSLPIKLKGILKESLNTNPLSV